MKAHFIASTAHLDKYIEHFNAIVSALKKLNVKLTHDWLESAREVYILKQKTLTSSEWESVYTENLDAMANADIIVAEVSNKSFLVGFLVARALQMKKPILLLSTHTNIDSALGASSNEEIIRFDVYDPENVESIIQDFVKENSTGGKDIRFNFFIDQKILNYLNRMSMQTGETKSEIIRRLLIKEINETNKKR